MAVASEKRTTQIFLGNGQVSDYPFDFVVFDKEDVVITIANHLGYETTYRHGDGGCTVTIHPDQDSQPGGSVHLSSPLPINYKLVINSSVRALQETHFTNQGGFYPNVLNGSLDKLTVLVQQLQERVNRSITAPVTNPELKHVIIEYLRYVSENMQLISQVAKQADAIQSISQQLEDITAIYQSINHIQYVASHIDEIQSVSAKVKEIDSIKQVLDKLIELHRNIRVFNELYSNLDKIKAVNNVEDVPFIRQLKILALAGI